MSKHSPAPWRYVKGDDNQPKDDLPDDVWGTIQDNNYYHIARIWGDVDKRHEPKANARLIASAPELLEALKELYVEEKRDDDDPILIYARIKAQAAIRKAEGGDA